MNVIAFYEIFNEYDNLHIGFTVAKTTFQTNVLL